MLAMAVARRAGEARDDDVGTEAPNGIDGIRKNLVASPFGQRFVSAF